MATKMYPPKFRVMKHAYRKYLAENCVITITGTVNVATPGAASVSGTMIQAGASQLKVTLLENEAEPRTVKGEKMVPVNRATGAWSVSFTGITPAGSHKIRVSNGTQPSIAKESAAFVTT